MVTVTSQIPVDAHNETVTHIQRIIHATPSLTPRSARQLRAAVRSQHLAVAHEEGEIIGWLLSTPYGATTHELGMAYIEPTHRNTGLLHRLIDELIQARPVSLAVTYETVLKRSLMKHWGFQPSSLREFIVVSRGGFLLSRFSSVRGISAVLRHTSKTRPMYLISRMDPK